MKVLVLCEYSGRVRDSFIKRGHNAISCDLSETDAIGPHYKGDAFNMLNQEWDLIIAHPPCTALCVAGNRTYGKGKEKHHERLEAAEWTQKLWTKCKQVSNSVCFENPVGVLHSLTNMPKANYVQPYEFGHLEQKKTGLYLYNLPILNHENNVYDEMMLLPKTVRERLYYLSPSVNRGKIRSLTYQGIANAFANQWG